MAKPIIPNMGKKPAGVGKAFAPGQMKKPTLPKVPNPKAVAAVGKNAMAASKAAIAGGKSTVANAMKKKV